MRPRWCRRAGRIAALRSTARQEAVSIRAGSPRWREINASAWEHERVGLAQIRDLFPDADPYQAWANVEFLGTDGSVNEVDLLVLTPSGLYLLELKH
jgi:hypothetical protein